MSSNKYQSKSVRREVMLMARKQDNARSASKTNMKIWEAITLIVTIVVITGVVLAYVVVLGVTQY